MTAGRRDFLGVVVLGGWSAALPSGGCGGPPVTVHLVRHAEKATAPAGAPPEPDPPLSEQGQRRADTLVAALEGVTLEAVFASEFKRTQETVAKAARARGLTVEAVAADDVEGLLARIRKHAGGAVLVAGHSNTVPAIAAGLGLAEPLALGESDYGDLFVVTSSGSGATLERRRFELG